MDIACPNCKAAYRVPDALLLQRKPLRCAACGHAWVPELPAEAPALPVAPILAAAVAQQASPAPEPPAPPPRPAIEAAPTVAAPVVNPPGAPRPASIPAEAPPAAPRPARGPATPPPLAEPKWPKGGRRRGGREPEPEDEEEDAPRPRRPRRRLSGGLLLLAWLLSLAVIGGTLTVLFLFREDVAEAWRPFLRVVDLIGG
jgi:predicted Zn finger-like uncharacterized protein